MRRLTWLLGLAMVLGFIFVGPAAAQPTVIVDGRTLSFDVPPVMENSRTLVPLRAIFEAMDAEVKWDGETQTVTATKEKKVIRLTLGATTAYVDNEAVTLDVPGRLSNGRTLVPLRFIGESFGAEVDWDSASDIINITMDLKRLITGTKVSSNLGNSMSRYGFAPHAILATTSEGNLAAATDMENDTIAILFLDEDYQVSQRLNIPKEYEKFGGFTLDESDNIYLLFCRNLEENDKGVNVSLIKYNKQGQVLGRYDESDFNIKEPIHAGTSRLTSGDGQVAIHMGRLYYQGKDGLNHQGGVLIVVNTDSMTVDDTQSITQTTGHSFDQRTIYDPSKKAFVVLDLGDNYPRGMQLMVNRTGRVVLTYKTNMPNFPSPYRDLPAGKWSNDNETYSQLGGVEISKHGYVVSGTTEKSTTFAGQSEPRNLFMVLVNRDFENTEWPRSWNIVSKEVVISKGEDSELFGFYNFDGGYDAQQRVGVVWLTDYTGESAYNPKLVALPNDEFAVLWEVWDFDHHRKYITTMCTIIDAFGKNIEPAQDIGSTMLPNGGDVLYHHGQLIWLNIEHKAAFLVAKPLERAN